MLNIDSKPANSEIPFNQIKGTTMILSTLGLMVFLITLCLSSSLLLNRSLEMWRHEAISGFTVMLPSMPDPQQHLLQHFEVIKFLKRIPGVLNLEMVNQEKRASIFSPWSPSTALPSSPSSTIEATIDTRVKINFPHIFSDLKARFPHIRLEHGLKSKELFLKIAHWMQGITLVIGGLMTMAAIFTIAFTTHTGLIIHERVIEILRLIGAEDRFIAKQFQNHALNLALKGGLIGIILSTLFYFFLAHLFDFTLFYSTTQSFPYTELMSSILFSPLLVGIVIIMSARTTVMFALSQEK